MRAPLEGAYYIPSLHSHSHAPSHTHTHTHPMLQQHDQQRDDWDRRNSATSTGTSASSISSHSHSHSRSHNRSHSHHRTHKPPSPTSPVTLLPPQTAQTTQTTQTTSSTSTSPVVSNKQHTTLPLHSQEAYISSQELARRRNKAHVASACSNCKRAHLACDGSHHLYSQHGPLTLLVARPCKRCVGLGKTGSCADVEHKRRGRPRLKELSSPNRTGPAAHPQQATATQQPHLHTNGSSPNATRPIAAAHPPFASYFDTHKPIADVPAFASIGLDLVRSFEPLADSLGRHGRDLEGRNLADLVDAADHMRVLALASEIREDVTRLRLLANPPVMYSPLSTSLLPYTDGELSCPLPGAEERTIEVSALHGFGDRVCIRLSAVLGARSNDRFAYAIVRTTRVQDSPVAHHPSTFSAPPQFTRDQVHFFSEARGGRPSPFTSPVLVTSPRPRGGSNELTPARPVHVRTSSYEAARHYAGGSPGSPGMTFGRLPAPAPFDLRLPPITRGFNDMRVGSLTAPVLIPASHSPPSPETYKHASPQQHQSYFNDPYNQPRQHQFERHSPKRAALTINEIMH